MSMNLVSDDQLRAALHPFRVAPDVFEQAVRQRIMVCQKRRANEPLAGLPHLGRAAAAFLPLPIVAGCKIKGVAAQLAPAAGAYKFFAYLAFPAISVFVLVGATVFSVVKIRGVQHRNDLTPDDQLAIHEAVRQWWREHKLGAQLVYGLTIALAFFGATWPLFLLYIVSFGLLTYVLTSFARIGLGNRQVIGQSCLTGLTLLGQVTMFPLVESQGIHFFNRGLLAAVFWAAVIVLVPVSIQGKFQIAPGKIPKMPRWVYGVVPFQLLIALLVWQMYPSLLILGVLVGSALVTLASAIYGSRSVGRPRTMTPLWTMGVSYVVLVLSLITWVLNPNIWPATPARIERYVESFDRAPFSSASWRQWEIVASWTLEAKLHPDLSGPRRLLAEEISGDQNPFVLGSAFRVGLVQSGQLSQLRDYRSRRRSLLDDPHHVKENDPISSIEQFDWVIRAAVLHNDLSPAERDFLSRRLNAGLDALSRSSSEVLRPALRATQLLQIIDRPVDRDRFRQRVHDWLRQSHSTSGGGFQLAGGFKTYLNLPAGFPGDPAATSDAVELMEIYGVPEGFDLNWVRSYLRPDFSQVTDRKWIAAVTLDRLNRLPGATRPTWIEIIYYERSLIAATVLAGLCIFATFSCPKAEPLAVEERSSKPDFPSAQ